MTGAPATTSVPPTTSTPPVTGDVPTEVDTGDIRGFETASIELNGETLLVAIADTPELRSRGLMGVVDFGNLHGMLFVYELATNGAFWMRNTLVPLDIAFFEGDGTLVKVLTMLPCPAEFADAECDRYRPDGPYTFALERPAGTLLGLPGDSVLVR